MRKWVEMKDLSKCYKAQGKISMGENYYGTPRVRSIFNDRLDPVILTDIDIAPGNASTKTFAKRFVKRHIIAHISIALRVAYIPEWTQPEAAV